MKFHSNSIQDTLTFGEKIGVQLDAGEVLALVGDLGAGKTHFVQGLAKGLGCDTAVSSPTFTLINEYPCQAGTLIHADLYRIESPERMEESGLAELLHSDAIVVVEWADKFPDLFSSSTRWFHFHLAGADGRIIEEIV